MMNSARRCAPSFALLLCLAAVLLVQPRDAGASRIDVWGTKPVLAYFVLNPQFQEQIRRDLRLSPAQWTAVQQIAKKESEQILALDRESHAIIENEALGIEQRRAQIEQIAYNARLLAAVDGGQNALAAALGDQQYTALVDWIERQWGAEQQAHGAANVSTASRTYRIFATQYAGESTNEVALPDKCLKFANRGWASSDCSSAYQRGQNYAVQLSHNGRTTTSRVWDVGPWNEDDNYWSSTTEAQARRRFRDLPQGLPQAEAAYFDNYNGGRDQFGRIVGNPAGIDLGDGVRRALGLAYLENTWIDVTYLWTGGTAPAPAPTPPPTPAPTPPPAPTPAPPPPGIVVRDTDDPHVERGGATQNLNSAPNGSLAASGHATWARSTGGAPTTFIKWKPPLDRCGDWEVLAFLPYIYNGIYDTTNARYQIRSRTGEQVRTVDQNAVTRALGDQRGDRWISLGTYTWSANAGAAGEYVLLSDATGERTTRSVNFDDLVWVYRGANAACNAPVEVPPKQPQMWLPMLQQK